jgi:hypothetical protein
MFIRKTREAYFSFQGCSVAVNPGAKKQREQLAGFPLSCVPQHILAKGQKMQEINKCKKCFIIRKYRTCSSLLSKHSEIQKRARALGWL